MSDLWITSGPSCVQYIFSPSMSKAMPYGPVLVGTGNVTRSKDVAVVPSIFAIRILPVVCSVQNMCPREMSRAMSSGRVTSDAMVVTCVPSMLAL